MPTALPSDIVEALARGSAALPKAAILRWHAEVDSTNDEALTLADAGAPDGTVVIADAQRAGRGRRGRTWFSPPGAGLYVSVVVRGRFGSRLPLLTLAAGVAAAQSVTCRAGLPVALKWPNDLVVGRPWRKLGGILCESTGGEAVIVGIGINLRPSAYPPDVGAQATSIEAELGRAVDRAPLLVEIVDRLLDGVGRIRDNDVGPVLADWRELARAGLEGASVRWHDGTRVRRGRTCGIDADGALMVESGGRIERVIAGEVTWESTT